MQVVFYPGWPLRYAHILVDGLRGEHVGNGLVCLWAEDDPAQVAGRDLGALFERIDQWGAAAQAGFAPEDRALDAFMTFEERGDFTAELPFSDLVGPGVNGSIAHLAAALTQPAHLSVRAVSHKFGDPTELQGAFYTRNHVGIVPRTLDEFLAALTNRQRRHLANNLATRSSAAFAEPSGGLDFVVLAWPRHGQDYDALVLIFQGRESGLSSQAVLATPNDQAARARRAGYDAPALRSARVLIAGAGSIGGYVAAGLAASGVEALYICDSDILKSGNVVRHLCGDDQIGMKKTTAVALAISKHAPWTQIIEAPDLSLDPDSLASVVSEFDLVLDCTGNFSVSAALAHLCNEVGTDLITVALFHQGRIARLQRQSEGDVRIAARTSDSRFEPVPLAETIELADSFLELGCTAPINNASPVAALTAAADATAAAIDLLTDRRERAQERYLVLQAMRAPFDRLGTIDYPIDPETTDG
jgi:hypothetical protein